jgi:hypothetical protein
MVLGTLSKSIVVTPSATVATNATASAGPFDIAGFDSVQIKCIHQAATNSSASAKWAELEVRVGDSTTYSSATAVNGLVGTTNSTASTSQFVLGVHNNTSFGSVTRLNLHKNKHAYAFVRYQVPATTNYNLPVFVVDAFNAAQAPNSASESGAAAIASAADTN